MYPIVSDSDWLIIFIVAVNNSPWTTLFIIWKILRDPSSMRQQKFCLEDGPVVNYVLLPVRQSWSPTHIHLAYQLSGSSGLPVTHSIRCNQARRPVSKIGVGMWGVGCKVNSRSGSEVIFHLYVIRTSTNEFTTVSHWSYTEGDKCSSQLPTLFLKDRSFSYLPNYA